VLDGFRWCDIEGGSAQRGRISTYHERNLQRSGTSIRTRLVVDVKDIYPVNRVSLMIIEQAPRAVSVRSKLWSAQERLPGIPDRLRQGQDASGRGIPPGYLKLEGDLIERALEDIGDVRPLNFTPSPFWIFGKHLRELTAMQVQCIGKRADSMLVTSVSVGSLQLDHPVLPDLNTRDSWVVKIELLRLGGQQLDDRYIER
jgi:hypothetical protein